MSPGADKEVGVGLQVAVDGQGAQTEEVGSLVGGWATIEVGAELQRRLDGDMEELRVIHADRAAGVVGRPVGGIRKLQAAEGGERGRAARGRARLSRGGVRPDGQFKSKKEHKVQPGAKTNHADHPLF